MIIISRNNKHKFPRQMNFPSKGKTQILTQIRKKPRSVGLLAKASMIPTARWHIVRVKRVRGFS